MPSCRSMSRSENPAPMTRASKRALSAIAYLQDRSGQMQGLDPPAAVLLFVGLVVVTGAVHLAAVGEDEQVFHRPDAGRGGGRGEGDLRGVAMMHGGHAFEAAHHHRHEVVDTF